MTLTKQDFTQLDQLLDKRFKQQDERLDAQFKQQDKRISKHLEQQDKSIEQRFAILPTIIREEIKVALDEAIEEKGLVTREDIAHLPTKDEFYAEMAKVHKQLDDLTEDHEVLVDRVSTHSDQIEKIEAQLNIAS